jgi:DNA adenine methylase
MKNLQEEELKNKTIEIATKYQNGEISFEEMEKTNDKHLNDFYTKDIKEPKKKAKSVLKLVEKEFNTKPENFMEKGFIKEQKRISDRGYKLIVKKINNPRTSAYMFRTLSLLSYSRDKDTFDFIDSLTDKEFIDYLKNKDNKIINTSSFSDDEVFKRFVLFVYAGAKQNHKVSQQEILSELLKDTNITSYYEPFGGAMGSVYNSIPVLLENGIKDIFISDINPSNINTYKQVQRNHKSVQRELSTIVLEFEKLNGKPYATNKEEFKEFFLKKVEELNKLEKLKRMNAKRAALFLYLMNVCQGGMCNYDMETKTTQFSCSWDGNKHKKIPLIINKVEIYHHIFKLANFDFKVKRYETVLKKIKNDSSVFVLLDPEYVEYVEEDEEVKTCRHTYTTEGKGFNHKQVLTLLNKGNNPFIYYNNHHRFIEEISKEQNYSYIKKDVEYTNGNKPKKSVEILMYSNRKPKVEIEPLKVEESIFVKPINNVSILTTEKEELCVA